ncbi:MAG: HlyD family efflux transporter periplasmic adaptor subunit, partial [Bacteroidales bacterium]
RNVETLQADFKKLEADNALNRAMLDARMKENKAGMAISQLDSVQMRYAPRVKQQLMALELEKSSIEEKKLQKKYEAEKKIDETEIRQLKSRIIQAGIRVQRMQDQLKGLTIVAPNSGMIAKSESPDNMMYSIDGEIVEMGSYLKVGSQVYPRMSLMALPELTEMQVSVEVQEVDYKRISKGQKVDIIVDAAKALRTTGSVKRKSLAPKNSYTGESKIKMYEVIVSVDSCHSRMPPGLSARCDIFISQVKDTVVIPTLAIFEKDSLKIVYVAEGDKFRPITVETGLSNSSQTIIIKGLAGTETISLVEPPQNFIEKPKNSTHE